MYGSEDRPSRAELASEAAEEALVSCVESGRHLTDFDENEHCLFCGWAEDPAEPELPVAHAA